MEILESSHQPIAADDIHVTLKNDNCSTSLSTIYRTLHTLVTNGLVNRIAIENETRALYEINRQDHHHYLICLGCNKLIKINGCPLSKEYELKQNDSNGFFIVGHKIELYGYCSSCQKAMSK